MRDYIVVCKDIGTRVKREVVTTFGTPSAERVLGIGAGGDHTTYLDHLCESSALNVLKKYAARAKAHFSLYSEECGWKEIGSRSAQPVYVFMDPLDGSFNATHGIPFFSISLAFSSSPTLRDVFFAYVENLITGTSYHAFRGEGAFKNDARIHVSRRRSIEGAVFSFTKRRTRMDTYVHLMRAASHVRDFGSLTLNLCFFAEGIFELFYSARTRTLDLAAPLLIAHEAGGICVNNEGNSLLDEGGTLTIGKDTTSVFCASNTHVFNTLFHYIHER